MDNLLALFGQSVDLFGAQVTSVGSDDWDKPTPDDEWNVRDLVKHLIDEHRWMPPLLGGHDLATAEQIVAGTVDSDDTAADWASAMVSSKQAVADPDVLTREVSLSRGPTPAPQYVMEMLFDAAIHAWDLGRALGNDVQLPEDIVDTLHPMIAGMKDMMAESGLFAPPVDIGSGASKADELLAATGRDPR
jgi:uncharacterized protein (TIGR03086 family)